MPPDDDTESSWIQLENATAYFPRAIEDMEPLLNRDVNHTRVYLGAEKRDGFIVRVEDDDEWLIGRPADDVMPAIVAVAASFGIPVLAAPFVDSVAEVFSRHVPEVSIDAGRLSIDLREVSH